MGGSKLGPARPTFGKTGFYIPRKSKVSPNHNTSYHSSIHNNHHTRTAMQNATIPATPESHTSTVENSPVPTFWRDQLATLRAWLTNLFAPLQCNRRSPKRLSTTTTASTQSDPMPQPTAPLTRYATSTSTPSNTTPTIVRDKVHAYVDAWYEANHDGLDLGRIDLPVIGEVDVFPDEREKALYRKVFMLALTNLLEIEVKVAGVPMCLSVVNEENRERDKGVDVAGASR